MYRTLRPGGASVDVSSYDFITFNASGSGSVDVQLQKAGINTWDHFNKTISLTPTSRKYTINFSEFARANGVRGQFKANATDVNLLAFYMRGRTANAPFSMKITDVRFGKIGVPNEASDELPTTIALNGNYPNPFNPSTSIGFDLPQATKVRLDVYDLLGKRVATVVDGFMSAGRHEATFDAANLPSGTYLYRLTVGNTILTKKMTLLK